MSKLDSDAMLAKMSGRGVPKEKIETLSYSGIDLHKWLKGFKSVEESVDMIKNHPLLPVDIPVHGLVIDPETGKLDLVVDGYNK